MGIKRIAWCFLMLLVSPGGCSQSLGDSGDILARDLSLDSSSLATPDELSDFGPRPISYGVRMAFSGASSMQSSGLESSASSGSFEKQDTVSQVYSGLSTLAGVGGLLAGTALAYRNWKAYSRAKDEKRNRQVILAVRNLPFASGGVRMEIRMDYTLEDDMASFLQRAVSALNDQLRASKEFKGKYISRARIFKQGSDASQVAARVLSIQELNEGETYLLVPAGVDVHQNYQICTQLENPCSYKDYTTPGCQRPNDLVPYRDTVGKRGKDMEVPPWEEWLKHTNIPISKSAGTHQLVQIADRLTGTYCSLWVTVPPERLISEDGVLANVYFIRKAITEDEDAEESEEKEEEAKSYYKHHNSNFDHAIHY